jgi:DNA-binding transcriptional LysR family regulator
MPAVPWDDRIKRRLKLRDLDILMAVIEAGGMGKAAHRLNLSQPAVSKAVADLEQALGVRLLDRSHQGVEATPYGRALVKRGVAAFDELRHGVQDIEFLADPTAGELRLGTTHPIAVALVAPIIDRLTRQHPRMAFHVAIDDAGAMYRELEQRNIEFVISRIVGQPAERYSTETLFHDSAVVVGGASNPLTRRRKIELADLADEPWMLLPFDSFFGSLAAAALRAGGLTLPRPTVASRGIPLREELLSTGRFLAVVPGFSLQLPRKHPTLRALPVTLPNMRHPIAIVTLKNRELSPLAQLFCERVRAITKPLAKEG